MYLKNFFQNIKVLFMKLREARIKFVCPQVTNI